MSRFSPDAFSAMDRTLVSHRSRCGFWFAVILVGMLSSAAHAQPASTTQAELIAQGVRETPRAVRAAVAAVEPSLVVIESFGGSTVTAGQMRGLRGQGEGNTTGVVLTADGWIVTSTFNFVRQPPVVTVKTSDGERHVARVAGRDETRNLCLLKLEGVSDLPVPTWVAPEDVEVGQWAISAGFGYGDDRPAISTGIISAVGRASGRALQTDANLSPANYGGPLLDLRGRVLGICVPLNPTAPGPVAGMAWYDSGIGFAIPIAGGEAWLERLKTGETLKFGYLGMSVEPSNDGLLQVKQVEDGSPAAEAGIQENDVLVGLEQVEIRDTTQLGIELRRYLAGTPIELEILREGESITMTVTLGSRPGPEPEIPPLQLESVLPEIETVPDLNTP